MPDEKPVSDEHYDLPADVPIWTGDGYEFDDLPQQQLLYQLVEHQKQVAKWAEYCFDAARDLMVFHEVVIDQLGTEANHFFNVLESYAESGKEELLERLEEAASAVSAKGEPALDRTCKVRLFQSALLGWLAYAELVEGDLDTALEYFGSAREWFGQAVGLAGAIWSDQSISSIARKGAAAKLKHDPKQLAKAEVKECWDMWQQHPARYKSKAEFARDMLSKYESLSSQPVIEGWCRNWESQVSRQTT